MNELSSKVITSLEVAEMVDKKHKDLLRDIRKYSEQLIESKIALNDFFVENSYVSENNRTVPCFLVTKKGCEFIAHKLTGQKGTEFTARYINRFHEMEDGIQMTPEQIPIGEIASYSKAMDRIFVRQGLAPHKIAEAFVMVSKQFGIQLPDGCVKVPEYEQLKLSVDVV